MQTAFIAIVAYLAMTLSVASQETIARIAVHYYDREGEVIARDVVDKARQAGHQVRNFDIKKVDGSGWTIPKNSVKYFFPESKRLARTVASQIGWSKQSLYEEDGSEWGMKKKGNLDYLEIWIKPSR